MMCSARVTDRKGSKECLRPVVPSSALQMCAIHLLLAVQTVDELGGKGALTDYARAEAR